MRAVITGTPVQIEGEPAEIAQLVELLSSGAVMVEHVHHWRLGDADDEGVQVGRCWCGAEKSFAPWGETAQPRAFRVSEGVTANQQAAIASGAHRKCRRCGQPGHRKDKCPSPNQAAA